jgi:hypothetical protein
LSQGSTPSLSLAIVPVLPFCFFPFSVSEFLSWLRRSLFLTLHARNLDYRPLTLEVCVGPAVQAKIVPIRLSSTTGRIPHTQSETRKIMVKYDHWSYVTMILRSVLSPLAVALIKIFEINQYIEFNMVKLF